MTTPAPAFAGVHAKGTRTMDHDWILWVITLATALHVVEEQASGGQGRAARVIGTRIGVIPSWADFWATNAGLIVVGIACSSAGWRAPGFALALPALCLINAVGFHLLPSLRARYPNPGLFSALALYVPLSIWAYEAAGRDGVLDAGSFAVSVFLGAALMAAAILVLGARFHVEDVDSETTPAAARGEALRR